MDDTFTLPALHWQWLKVIKRREKKDKQAQKQTSGENNLNKTTECVLF